jgi:membrane protein implicated in regulation of membrane protease activity
MGFILWLISAVVAITALMLFYTVATFVINVPRVLVYTWLHRRAMTRAQMRADRYAQTQADILERIAQQYDNRT